MRISGSRCAATGEAEAGVHARAVALDRRVDEVADSARSRRWRRTDVSMSDRFMPMIDAVEIDVLAAREVGVKAGRDLDQRADPSVRDVGAERRTQKLREDLEQCRLARAVVPDDPERVAALHLERHIAKRPEIVPSRARSPAAHRAESAARRPAPDRAGCRAARRGGISSRRRPSGSRRRSSRSSHVLGEERLQPPEHHAPSRSRRHRAHGGVHELPRLPPTRGPRPSPPP